MSVLYNVRKKIFADGTVQYMFHDMGREVGYEDDRPKKKGKGGDKERSHSESLKRTIQAVYDIAKANVWEWFITLTFDPEKVNSYDYDECADCIKAFIRCLRDISKDFVYLLVPEQHESGAYHFHGLLRGPLPHEVALNPWGKPIFDDKGHQVYNIPIYNYGFTTAIKCYSQAATGYVAKYITKQDSVPEGRKRYWASRGCARPKLEYLELSKEEYCSIFNASDYQKVTESPWGRCELLEIHGERGKLEADTEVNKIKILFT